MSEEIWKDIAGFEGRFKVSNLGRIMSINGKWKGQKILTNPIDDRGYKSVMLRWIKLKRLVRIHTLVAETFIGAKPKGQRITVNHINGIKTDNRVGNLEWIEARENVMHAITTGLFNTKGEKHYNRILTNEQAHAIKYKMIGFTQQRLADIFGVCREQIRDMRKGVGWNHITENYSRPISSISKDDGS